MKVIIAGSRSITDYNQVKKILDSIDIEITEIVSGCADGIDSLGEAYAQQYGIPIKFFPADWENLNVKPCITAENKHGKYNKLAGFNRNIIMAEYADALILIWDGKSHGSKHMLETAKNKNLKIVQVIV